MGSDLYLLLLKLIKLVLFIQKLLSIFWINIPSSLWHFWIQIWFLECLLFYKLAEFVKLWNVSNWFKLFPQWCTTFANVSLTLTELTVQLVLRRFAAHHLWMLRPRVWVAAWKQACHGMTAEELWSEVCGWVCVVHDVVVNFRRFPFSDHLLLARSISEHTVVVIRVFIL